MNYVVWHKQCQVLNIDTNPGVLRFHWHVLKTDVHRSVSWSAFYISHFYQTTKNNMKVTCFDTPIILCATVPIELKNKPTKCTQTGYYIHLMRLFRQYRAWNRSLSSWSRKSAQWIESLPIEGPAIISRGPSQAPVKPFLGYNIKISCVGRAIMCDIDYSVV